MHSELFWDLVFDLIMDGQNLTAISKALDVPKGPFGVGLMSLKITGIGMMRQKNSRMK